MRLCETSGCEKEAKLQCPTCLKIGLDNFFCTQVDMKFSLQIWIRSVKFLTWQCSNHKDSYGHWSDSFLKKLDQFVLTCLPFFCVINDVQFSFYRNVSRLVGVPIKQFTRKKVKLVFQCCIKTMWPVWVKKPNPNNFNQIIGVHMTEKFWKFYAWKLLNIKYCAVP